VTRCFLGFELEEESRRYLHTRVASLHAALRARGRWPIRLVRPENWHLTLLFFPDLAEADRAVVWEPIEAAVRNGAFGDLAFAWQGLSLWPSARRPSLIALEAEPYEPAQAWPVAPLLETPPFSKADVRHFTPFRPHITLIRIDPRWRKTIPGLWEEVTADVPPLDPAAIRFHAVSFLLSTLSSDQPVYPREWTVTLH
jgi:2'-5' RNA ligase